MTAVPVAGRTAVAASQVHDMDRCLFCREPCPGPAPNVLAPCPNADCQDLWADLLDAMDHAREGR